MAKGRRKNRLLVNGRNATSVAFLMLDNYVFDCPAYRGMAPGPRTLLWELIRRHNGCNNGQIGLGVREAAECLKATKDTAAGYFRTLIVRGFIAQSKPGGFNMKDPSSRRATEWRLTWQRCNDQPPTKEFMDYSKKITVQNIETPRPKNLDTGEQNAPDCPKNLDQSRQKRALTGQDNLDTYTSSHRHGGEMLLGWWQPDWTPQIASWAFATSLTAIGNSIPMDRRHAP